VQVGPLTLQPQRTVAPGAVKVAVRPEAWQVVAGGVTPAGGTLDGTLLKTAYLGSLQELTLATPLGEIFVVSPDVQRPWRVGDTLRLSLAQAGVSVVAA
jgi:iron(III) transport system ATP-binding protein